MWIPSPFKQFPIRLLMGSVPISCALALAIMLSMFCTCFARPAEHPILHLNHAKCQFMAVILLQSGWRCMFRQSFEAR